MSNAKARPDTATARLDAMAQDLWPHAYRMAIEAYHGPKRCDRRACRLDGTCHGRNDSKGVLKCPAGTVEAAFVAAFGVGFCCMVEGCDDGAAQTNVTSR